MTIRVYLAARYSRHPEMRGVRDVLPQVQHFDTWADVVRLWAVKRAA